jgi:hypothetical protein
MKAWHSPRLWLPATNHLRDRVEISAIIFEPSRRSFQSNRSLKHKLDGRDPRLAGASANVKFGPKVILLAESFTASYSEPE